MKIYKKLLAGFIGFSLFAAGNAFIIWENSERTKIRATKILHDTSRELDLAIDISSSIEIIHEYTEKITNLDIKKEEDRKNILKFQEKIRQEIAKIDNHIEIGKDLTNQESKLSHSSEKNSQTNIAAAEEDQAKDLEGLEELKFQLAEFQNEIKQLLELTENNDLEAVKIFYSRNLQEKRERIKVLLNEYQKRSLEETRKVQERIISAQELYGTLNNYLFAIDAVLLILFFIYMYRCIYGPLEQIEDLAESKRIKLKLEPKNIKDSELNVLVRGVNWLIDNGNAKEVIINSIPESTIVINAERIIQKANKATFKMLGYSREELIGKKIDKIFADQSTLDIEKIVQTEGFPLGNEIQYLSKRNERIPIAFSARVMRDRDNKVVGIVCSARDTSEQRRSQQQLQESIQQYQVALSAASSGIWNWDVKSDRFQYSTPWKAMLGYGEREIDDNLEEWLKRLHPEDAKAIEQQINSFITSKENHFEATYQIQHKSGVYLWMLTRASALRNIKGRIERVVGSQIDITQLKLAQEKALQTALYDEVTGLPNRASLIQQLDSLYKNSIILARQKSNYNFALMSLQINRFQTIDASLGHKIGDTLLLEIIARLQAELPKETTIARLGEDKLAVVVKNIGDVKEVKAIASEIQTQLEKPFDLEKRQVYITTNIGIAMSSSEYERSEYMLRDAETALDRAIESEVRCGYAVFEASESMKVLANLELESDLRRGINNSEFKVFYQPIVRLNNNKIIGFETSVYWQHPQKGIMQAEQFMPAVAKTKSIVPITWSIITLVCEQMRQWQQQYPDDFAIFTCIELSEALFAEPDLVERISGILTTTGLEPYNLKLKINESSIRSSGDRVRSVMQRLQRMGIKVSLDGFAKGYLSLRELANWPIDSLKIDTSTIDPLHIKPEELKLIEAVINLATSSGIDVIASELETNKQSSRFVELGCQYGQGSLFSNLLTSEIARALIANQYSSSNKKSKIQST